MVFISELKVVFHIFARSYLRFYKSDPLLSTTFLEIQQNINHSMTSRFTIWRLTSMKKNILS